MFTNKCGLSRTCSRNGTMRRTMGFRDLVVSFWEPSLLALNMCVLVMYRYANCDCFYHIYVSDYESRSYV